jgi:hypothetical protein
VVDQTVIVETSVKLSRRLRCVESGRRLNFIEYIPNRRQMIPFPVRSVSLCRPNELTLSPAMSVVASI